MAHIYPGVSSISEHSALKACINQFQKKSMWQMKQANFINNDNNTNLLNSKWD